MTEDEFKHGLEEEWRNGYRVGRLEEREKVAQWMISRGYATGHGDTIEDLLKELEWQIAEQEREACAKVCDEILEHTKKLGKEDAMFTAISCAVAILARGEK